MQTSRLGKTDIEISKIGLGTVKFGRNQGVKYPTAFTLPSDDDILRLLSSAKEMGVNLLDTAPAYGSSEERLGVALQSQRHHWVISTKAGEEFINGESHFDFSPSAITASVERSLKRLKTDYLDVVLVHSNGNDVKIIEEDHVFSTLAALKKAGKIRAFGMSTKTVAGGLLTVDLADVVMVAFNPYYQIEREVITSAQQKQKDVFIKKALSSGHLTTTATEVIQQINQEPGISSIIIGTLNTKHLQECVAAVN